jgi:hypothetical protein
METIRLKSKFFDEVGEIPLPEYPRPQLVRESYINLNGKWNFEMLKKGAKLGGYTKQILVPFSPESLLSGLEGIQAALDDVLYYNRKFEIPKGFLKEVTYLHFGAVDYEFSLTINGKAVGAYKSGFFPVSVDVSDFVREGANEISLEITDPTDTGVQARAKQKIKRGGIWYTPQSGIWQTVWLESAPKVHVKSIWTLPDIDKGEAVVKVDIAGTPKNATVAVLDNGKEIAKAEIKNGTAVLPMKGCALWSPQNPKLYDLEIRIDNDVVKSYFGMRKFHIMEDKDGIKRLALNNAPYFHNGVLDQGYWSDGMLTPPTDGALEYDVKLVKDMGFNMIRKHIKIEPLRWYYHCDRLGIIVWQDMPSGGGAYNFWAIGTAAFFNIKLSDKEKNYALLAREDKAGREEYVENLKTMVEYLKNCVSLAIWVPFNEGWGQFESEQITRLIKQLDPTRVVDSVSGWNDQGKNSSELKSLHIYFKPIRLPRDPRCIVLSEFGGYSLKTDGHVFSPHKSFGYRIYKTDEGLLNGYTNLFLKRIKPLIKKGLSATVYTQVSDVEEEINGFITYDRKVVKMPIDAVRKINDVIKLD